MKVIGRAGVGVDNVDVEAATRRGIIVMNTPGGNTISTAEHAFSLLVSTARNIPQAHASMKAGKWERKNFEGVELYNKTLAVLGMGRIGAEISRRAIAFGMRVLAYDPYLSATRARSLQVELMDDLDELVSRADFITLHMPLTKETHHMLDDARLHKVKHGVRIINCARGGLVDEAALAEALKDGRVAGAALDVYENEPPGADFALRDFSEHRPHPASRRIDGRGAGRRRHRDRGGDPRRPARRRGAQRRQHAEHRREDPGYHRPVPRPRRAARHVRLAGMPEAVRMGEHQLSAARSAKPIPRPSRARC